MDNLNILQWNARGIKSHLGYLSNYIENRSVTPDVICIQESFLKPHHRFYLKDYISVRKDRIGLHGGGVVTLIKKSLSFLTLPCPQEVEAVGIKFESSQGDLNIFNVYNPGNVIPVEDYKTFFYPK